MTTPGPTASSHDTRAPRDRSRAATYAWALIPLLTFGFGAPVAYGIALGRRRDRALLTGLALTSTLAAAGCAAAVASAPFWALALLAVAMSATAVAATAHLLLIRSSVWAPPRTPQVPVAHMANHEVLDRARKLREQARRTADADPVLAKRLCIGRPDLPRQFDDGGLVDVNHAPPHVLTTLPGVTESSARQIRDRVEEAGPFANLGEVLLAVEISPTFEHHLREHCVFIP